MRKMRKLSVLSVLVLCAMGVLLFMVGCSKETTPLSPAVENELVPTKPMATNEYGFKILQTNTHGLAKEFLNSRWIGPWGGTLEVGDREHGISSLTFHRWSVHQWIYVTFWWESTGFLEGGSEFSPHGIQFDVPVTLKLSYKDANMDGVNEDNLKIYYYNQEKNAWEALVSVVDKEEKVLIANLEHFSRYAIGTDP